MRAEDNSQMTTLSPASYQIVMTAIKHAKMKGHCQVQPLHVAAALLDPVTRSDTLYNACLQSLEEPSHPLKCDALDLCFKVALDRLPVITDPEKNKDLGMNNALGAALKRAHANERRGTPEQSLQPLLAVKTGIAHLTISILDDPSVSRVFREAGFSSTAVKNNMEEAVAKSSFAGPVGPTLDNSGLRRMQLPIVPFSGVQFRKSFFTGPFSAGDSSMNHVNLVERGRMSGSSNGMDVVVDTESSPFYATVPLKSPSQLDRKRPEVVSGMLGQSTLTHFHEADIRNIVETFVAGPKKRNAVLVSESGPNSLLKELSQRLARGEVPSLRGVQRLDLPFTSLSVGIMSHEVFEQKLVKLKRDVDGSVRTGGAILSVGDLQWLLDPSQTMAARLVQELQQLMNMNENNRLWLLASASPKTMERCRADNLILLDSLELHTVLLASDSPGRGLQPSHFSIKNAEISFLSQTGGLNLAPIRNGLQKPDSCPDCNSKYQSEFPYSSKEQQTLCVGPGQLTGGLAGNSKLPWMHNSNDKGCATLAVKEEETLISRRKEELRQKCEKHCSTHQHVHPGGLTRLSRDHSASPVAEVVLPHEKNSGMSLPMLSGPVSSKWSPQSLKVPNERMLELAPLHARIAKGNMPNLLTSSKLSTGSLTGQSETKGGFESCSSPLSWMRRDPGNGPHVSMKPNILVGKSGYPDASVATDLALGRPSLGPVSPTRDLRDEGRHPRHLKVQQPNTNPRALRMSSQMGAIRSSHTENLNGLCSSLSNVVSWQKEAVGAVAATVMKCRSGEGRRASAYHRTDCWLMFLGPDRVGKREVAKALAKLVFGREEQLILVTGWQSDASGRTPPSTGILAADGNGVKFRGKTPLDRLAEALLRKPFSVVLLEDIDCADSMLKKNLMKSMERGRLTDSIGREVTLGNVIVIMTCGAGATLLSRHRHRQERRGVEFCEEKLCELGPHDVRLFVDNKTSGNVLHTRGKVLSIVDSIKTQQPQKSRREDKPAESILLFGSPMFKRKAVSTTQDGLSRGSRSPHKLCKREECSPGRAFSLDLNLSVDENLSEDEEPCITEELCGTSAPESLEELTAKVIECARGECPAEMFTLVDEAVVFKPFNLNDLTDWVLERLEGALEPVVRSVKVSVEIDTQLLEVMVSFAWENFSNPDLFEGWVDTVLMRTMSGLAEKGSLYPDAVVKVIGVERNLMTPGSADGAASLGLKVELLPRIIEVEQ